MNPLTIEWVQKAEGDYATSKREVLVRNYPNYDAVCFHAQQCAEKYLRHTYKNRTCLSRKLTTLSNC